MSGRVLTVQEVQVTAHDPLPIDAWTQRWKVTNKWDVLHRVAGVTQHADPREYDDSLTDITGTTCCGQTGRLQMPGVLSRLAMRRCPECCRIAGVIDGYGMPGNEGLDESVRTWAAMFNEWAGAA